MNEKEFKDKTKRFGIEVIRLVDELPNKRTVEVLARQLLRAATGVGANYRAACRGRSKADVIAKLGVVEEEADESRYWLEVLLEANLVSSDRIIGLLSDADEILAMTVASIKTLRQRSEFLPQTMLAVSKIQNPKSKITQ